MKDISIGNKIFRITVLVGFLGLLSKILGLVRDMVLANKFGATSNIFMDAYYAAIKAPNMLFFIISGALAAVVVPVFVECVTKGEKKEAWDIFNRVFNGVTVLFIAIVAIGMIFSPYTVKLYALGLPYETAALAADLARILFPMVLFAGWAALFTGLLNANQVFGIPAFSSAVNNIVLIAGILLFSSQYGIHGAAYATVVAMATMALIQAPVLYRVGYRYKPTWNFDHPGVRQVIILIMPAALGFTAVQAYGVIETQFASYMSQGTIAVLNYANKLVQFPIGLFVVAMSIAAFPAISAMAAGGEKENYASTVNTLLRVAILGMLPASVGLMVLSQPTINLFYLGGDFVVLDAEMTSKALFFYCIGLTGQAVNIILTKAFYAIQDTRTPVKITLATVVANLGFSLILIRPLQFAGLALANSLASLIGTVLFLVLFHRKTGALSWSGLARFIVPVAVAAALLALTSSYVSAAVGLMGIAGKLGYMAQILAAAVAGMTVYAAATYLGRVEEWQVMIRYIKRATGR